MTSRAWKQEVFKGDDEYTLFDLLPQTDGGSNLFNRANIGFFMAHGAYGTSPDFSYPSGGSEQTYFGIYETNYSLGTWFGLTQFNFGGSSTNGLRWMAILACNSLPEDNWGSMWVHESLPINDDLHLLLGCATYAYATSDLGDHWARHLLGSFGTFQKTVQEAWYNAGIDAYKGASTNVITNTVLFSISGWPDNLEDKITDEVPGGTGNPSDIVYREQQVFP